MHQLFWFTNAETENPHKNIFAFCLQSSCTKPDVDADVQEIELDQSNEVNILTPEAVRSSERSLLGQEKESDGMVS